MELIMNQKEEISKRKKHSQYKNLKEVRKISQRYRKLFSRGRIY
jgi:hypothetical protein